MSEHSDCLICAYWRNRASAKRYGLPGALANERHAKQKLSAHQERSNQPSTHQPNVTEERS